MCLKLIDGCNALGARRSTSCTYVNMCIKVLEVPYIIKSSRCLSGGEYLGHLILKLKVINQTLTMDRRRNFDTVP